MKKKIEGLLLFVLAIMFLIMGNKFPQNWINFVIFLSLADLFLNCEWEDK
jgi:hypothetical protein